jgi:hypothetical protein
MEGQSKIEFNLTFININVTSNPAVLRFGRVDRAVGAVVQLTMMSSIPMNDSPGKSTSQVQFVS